MKLILHLTTTFKIYKKRTKFQWNHLSNEKKASQQSKDENETSEAKPVLCDDEVETYLEFLHTRPGIILRHILGPLNGKNTRY